MSLQDPFQPPASHPKRIRSRKVLRFASDPSSFTPFMVGIDYRTAHLELRGQAALSGSRHERFLFELLKSGVRSVVVVSTCNRTEIYGDASMEAAVWAAWELATGVPTATLREYGIVRHGMGAVRHLFRLASGLDSAVLGETEVVGQLKRTYATAAEEGRTNPGLDLIFQRAFAASKRVRTETGLSRNVLSVGVLAVREANVRPEHRVVVLGAGHLAERLIRELHAQGVTQVTILNRTDERSARLAAEYGYAALPMGQLDQAIHGADVVFSAVNSPRPIVTHALLDRVMGNRRHRPLTLVDLGVPRNIEPNPPHASLIQFDMDAFVAQRAHHSSLRAAAVPEALAILEEEIDRIRGPLAAREAAPTIRTLVAHGDQIRRQNVEWAHGRLRHLGESEKRVIEDLARRMAMGLLAPALDALKVGELSNADRRTLERAFRLEPHA